MNIIICGAGRVGFTIAKLLSEQNHSITVIDQSSEDIQKINDSLDVKGIVGKATYPSILEKADAVDADMIIAVTKNDEINMLICQIAYTVFNVPKKIARIRSQDYLNPKFSKVYNKENLPIDVIISPEIEIAKSIQRKLEAPGALDNVTFAQNKIRLLEILVNDNCKLINIPLNQITKKFPNLEANILGVIRNEKFFILKKNDVMKKDDKAYVVINSDQMSQTLIAFGHEEKIATKILIIGGGNIGFNLAKNIEQSFESARVKIIEKDKARAEFIANELNNSIIINGNGLDEDVRIGQRLHLPASLLKGFKPRKIGPMDGGDYVGGNYAAALGFNASLPNVLPAGSNTDLNLFLDMGNVWHADYSSIVGQSNKLRSAVGISANWFSPIGPFSFVLATDITSAGTDATESFRFQLGTTF